jgi:hypothetical protein
MHGLICELWQFPTVAQDDAMPHRSFPKLLPRILGRFSRTLSGRRLMGRV